jgi:hypothetical protein
MKILWPDYFPWRHRWLHQHCHVNKAQCWKHPQECLLLLPAAENDMILLTGGNVPQANKHTNNTQPEQVLRQSMVYLLQVYRSQYIRLQERELLSESTWSKESSTMLIMKTRVKKSVWSFKLNDIKHLNSRLAKTPVLMSHSRKDQCSSVE